MKKYFLFLLPILLWTSCSYTTNNFLTPKTLKPEDTSTFSSNLLKKIQNPYLISGAMAASSNLLTWYLTKKQYADLPKINESLTKTNEQVQKTLQQKQIGYKNLQEDLEKKNKEFEELQKKNETIKTSAQKEKTHLAKSRQEAKQKIKIKHENEIKKLQNEKTKQAEDFAKQIETKTNTLKNLESDYKQIKNELQGEKEKSEEKDNTITQLQNQIDKLEGARKKMETKILKISSEQEQLEKRREQAKKTKIQILNKKNTSTQTPAGKELSNFLSIKKTLQSKNELIQNLTKKNTDLNDQIEELKTSIAKEKEHTTSLKKKTQETIEKLTRALNEKDLATLTQSLKSSIGQIKKLLKEESIAKEDALIVFEEFSTLYKLITTKLKLLSKLQKTIGLKEYLNTAITFITTYEQLESWLANYKDLSDSFIVIEETKKLNMDELKPYIVHAKKIEDHIKKHQAIYQQFFPSAKNNLEALTAGIFNYIIEGGKLWHQLQKEEIQLDLTQITAIIWFLYSEGIYTSALEHQPEEFTFILTGETAQRLFSLLRKQESAKDRIASHLKASEGFKNRDVFGITAWYEGNPNFLPMGKRTILFVSGEKDGKTFFLIKPENYGARDLKHAFEFVQAQGRKKAPNMFGSDDQEIYRKERLPKDIKTKYEKLKKAEASNIFEIYKNLDSSKENEKYLKELIESRYKHCNDLDSRLGNELSLSKVDNAAKYYSSSKEEAKQKTKLEKEYQVLLLKNLKSLGTKLKLENSKGIKEYYKLVQKTIKPNPTEVDLKPFQDTNTTLTRAIQSLETEIKKIENKIKNPQIHSFRNLKDSVFVG